MSEHRILITVLLAAYPMGWRRRYGDEYTALLADHLATRRRRPALIANILRGALDARLHSLGASMTRTPMATAIWATGVFTIAGIGFQKLTEDQSLGGSHSPATLVGLFVMVAAAMVALGALVVAALPTAIAMLRGRANGAWPYVAVPFAAAAAGYGVLRVSQSLANGHGVHSAPTVIAAVLIVIACIGVVVATAWSANEVLTRVAAPVRPALRRSALGTLAVGMGIATLAAVGWGLALRHADTVRFVHRDGLFASPFVPSWIATLLIMAAATALAAVAARRASSPSPEATA